MKRSALRTILILATAFQGTLWVHARELSFAERVAAQEAIERVYYSHQIGAAKPFEEAVPDSVIEDKVHSYLKQSVALDSFWNTPVTAELLEAEWERIARESHYPDRLREIYTALNNDSFLIQECFVRQVLSERLSRHLYSMDQQIHADARQQAELLHERLREGRINVIDDSPARSVLLLSPDGRSWTPALTDFETTTEERNRSSEGMAPESGSQVRSGRIGKIGPLLEDDDAFFTTALNATGDLLAVYSTRKETWESWWRRNEGLLEEQVEPVASSSVNLPMRTQDSNIDEAWLSVSTLNAPTARRNHSAVWTGSYMIVWGGFNDYTTPQQLRSGGRYDPITNTWTGISVLNSPDPVEGPAVWTGQYMVVFALYPTAKNSGRYDPMSNTWLPMSMVNSPGNRFGYTTIWTGSKIVVWGGADVDHGLVLNQDGGLYDPSHDTWTRISTHNAPEARTRHVAVWTGTRMLVWGGGGTTSLLSSGGQYDPLTDSWLPMTTTNAPQPRKDATAVWTGSNMIVWGGDVGHPSYLDSGGRYDPVADSWLSTVRIDAPLGRTEHTAIWTGKEMIVWGGVSQQFNGFSLASGGRYDPVTDLWVATSTLNTPAPRILHTAVWTGEAMIIWGGADFFTTLPRFFPPRFPLFDTGGLYTPPKSNRPPVANAGTDLQVECLSAAGTQVILDGSGSSDPDSSQGTNDGITVFEWFEDFSQPTEKLLGTGQNPSVSLPVGTHHISLRVKDALGETDLDDLVVRIVDTTPPTLACPLVATAECNSPDGAFLELQATASDSCGSSVLIQNDHGASGSNGSGEYALGTTIVTFTASDVSGNSTTCSSLVKVNDSTPPEISVLLSPTVLWPPNHRMVETRASVVVSDACSSPSVVLTSIVSNELDDAAVPTDGNTAEDTQGHELGTSDFDFQLRAERDGNGSGRIYSIAYSAIDASGNSTEAKAFVMVPHSMAGSIDPLQLEVQQDLAGTTVMWTPVPQSRAYSVIRGSVHSLREMGDSIDLGSVVCVQFGSSEMTASVDGDGGTPPVGEVFFYLVSYNDGQDSSYGTATASKPRVASGGGCPDAL